MGNEESLPYIDDVNKRSIIKNSSDPSGINKILVSPSSNSSNNGRITARKPFTNANSPVLNSYRKKLTDDISWYDGGGGNIEPPSTSSLQKKLSISLLQKLPLFGNDGGDDVDNKDDGMGSSDDVKLDDSPVTPPGPDLSQLSRAEKEHIANVLARAKKIERDEDDRLREIENELNFIELGNGSSRGSGHSISLLESETNSLAPIPLGSPASAAAFTGRRSSSISMGMCCSLCSRQLPLDTSSTEPGHSENATDEALKRFSCANCDRRVCEDCGGFTSEPGSMFAELLCSICQKKRHLVLSSGMWFHGLCHAPFPKTQSIQDLLFQPTSGRSKIERTASYSQYEDMKVEEAAGIGPLSPGQSSNATPAATRGAMAGDNDTILLLASQIMKQRPSLPDNRLSGRQFLGSEPDIREFQFENIDPSIMDKSDDIKHQLGHTDLLLGPNDDYVLSPGAISGVSSGGSSQKQINPEYQEVKNRYLQDSSFTKSKIRRQQQQQQIYDDNNDNNDNNDPSNNSAENNETITTTTTSNIDSNEIADDNSNNYSSAKHFSQDQVTIDHEDGYEDNYEFPLVDDILNSSPSNEDPRELDDLGNEEEEAEFPYVDEVLGEYGSSDSQRPILVHEPIEPIKHHNLMSSSSNQNQEQIVTSNTSYYSPGSTTFKPQLYEQPPPPLPPPKKKTDDDDHHNLDYDLENDSSPYYLDNYERHESLMNYYDQVKQHHQNYDDMFYNSSTSSMDSAPIIQLDMNHHNTPDDITLDNNQYYMDPSNPHILLLNSSIPTATSNISNSNLQQPQDALQSGVGPGILLVDESDSSDIAKFAASIANDTAQLTSLTDDCMEEEEEQDEEEEEEEEEIITPEYEVARNMIRQSRQRHISNNNDYFDHQHHHQQQRQQEHQEEDEIGATLEDTDSDVYMQLLTTQPNQYSAYLYNNNNNSFWKEGEQNRSSTSINSSQNVNFNMIETFHKSVLSPIPDISPRSSHSGITGAMEMMDSGPTLGASTTTIYRGNASPQDDQGAIIKANTSNYFTALFPQPPPGHGASPSNNDTAPSGAGLDLEPDTNPLSSCSESISDSISSSSSSSSSPSSQSLLSLTSGTPDKPSNLPTNQIRESNIMVQSNPSTETASSTSPPAGSDHSSTPKQSSLQMRKGRTRTRVTREGSDNYEDLSGDQLSGSEESNETIDERLGVLLQDDNDQQPDNADLDNDEDEEASQYDNEGDIDYQEDEFENDGGGNYEEEKCAGHKNSDLMLCQGHPVHTAAAALPNYNETNYEIALGKSTDKQTTNINNNNNNDYSLPNETHSPHDTFLSIERQENFSAPSTQSETRILNNTISELQHLLSSTTNNNCDNNNDDVDDAVTAAVDDNNDHVDHENIPCCNSSVITNRLCDRLNVPPKIRSQKSLVNDELLFVTKLNWHYLSDLAQIHNVEWQLDKLRLAEQQQMTEIHHKLTQIHSSKSNNNNNNTNDNSSIMYAHNNRFSRRFYSDSYYPTYNPTVQPLPSYPSYVKTAYPRYNPPTYATARPPPIYPHGNMDDQRSLYSLPHYSLIMPPYKYPSNLRHFSRSSDHIPAVYSHPSYYPYPGVAADLSYSDQGLQYPPPPAETQPSYKYPPPNLDMELLQKEQRVLELEREIELRKRQIEETIRYQEELMQLADANPDATSNPNTAVTTEDFYYTNPDTSYSYNLPSQQQPGGIIQYEEVPVSSTNTNFHVPNDEEIMGYMTTNPTRNNLADLMMLPNSANQIVHQGNSAPLRHSTGFNNQKTAIRPLSGEYDNVITSSHYSQDVPDSTTNVNSHTKNKQAATLPKTNNYRAFNNKKTEYDKNTRKYIFQTKRLLLMRDSKEKNLRGNGVGMRIIGGQLCSDGHLGAFVEEIFPGSVADRLQDQVKEGDELVEWNGVQLIGKTFEEVRSILNNDSDEIEILVRVGSCSRSPELNNSMKELDGPVNIGVRSLSSVYENMNLNEGHHQSRHQSKGPHKSGPITNQHQSNVSNMNNSSSVQGNRRTQSIKRQKAQEQDTNHNEGHNINYSDLDFGCPAPTSSSSNLGQPPPSSSSLPRQQQPQQQQQQQQPTQPPQPTQISSPPSNKKRNNPSGTTTRQQPSPNPTNVNTSGQSGNNDDNLSTHSDGKKLGEIQLIISFDDYDQSLTIHVAKAKHLLPMDMNGLSDPFVKVRLHPDPTEDPDFNRQTRYMPNTLSPEWQQTVVFMNILKRSLKKRVLEVSVWDFDRLKSNDFMGQALISLANKVYLDGKPRWYKLCEQRDVDIPGLRPAGQRGGNSGSGGGGGNSSGDTSGGGAGPGNSSSSSGGRGNSKGKSDKSSKSLVANSNTGTSRPIATKVPVISSPPISSSALPQQQQLTNAASQSIHINSVNSHVPTQQPAPPQPPPPSQSHNHGNNSTNNCTNNGLGIISINSNNVNNSNNSNSNSNSVLPEIKITQTSSESNLGFTTNNSHNDYLAKNAATAVAISNQQHHSTSSSNNNNNSSNRMAHIKSQYKNDRSLRSPDIKNLVRADTAESKSSNSSSVTTDFLSEEQREIVRRWLGPGQLLMLSYTQRVDKVGSLPDDSLVVGDLFLSLVKLFEENLLIVKVVSLRHLKVGKAIQEVYVKLYLMYSEQQLSRTMKQKTRPVQLVSNGGNHSSGKISGGGENISADIHETFSFGTSPDGMLLQVTLWSFIGKGLGHRMLGEAVIHLDDIEFVRRISNKDVSGWYKLLKPDM